MTHKRKYRTGSLHKRSGIFRAMMMALLFVVSVRGVAINPAEKARVDFKKVNDLYSATTSYSLDIQYSVFDSHAGGNLVEQKSGKYLRYQESSYSKVLDIETIVNPKRTIVVNHEDKFVVITDTKKISLSPLQTDVEKLLGLCSSIQVEDEGSAVRHYTLHFSADGDPEFSKIEIFINLGDYSIRKMVLYYNEEMPLDQNDYYAKEKKPRLEVVYRSFTPVTTASAVLFSEATYISENNAVYRGKGKTASYEIINQLQSVRFKKK